MEIYYLILGGICALLLLILIVLTIVNQVSSESKIRSLMIDSERAKRREMDEMKNQVQDEMNELKDRLNHDLILFQNTLSHSFREEMNDLNEATARRLNRIELSVSDSLMKGFDKTSQSFQTVVEKMARIDETQKNLQELSKNMISLEKILTDKKTRGIYGEIELYSLLENVFGPEGTHYHKQVKLSNGLIADCVVKGASALGNLVIDSKFPLENYNRMINNNSTPQEKNRAISEFKKDVKLHIQTIADKYLIPEETAEFACMFIPAEAVFAQIVSQFDDLVQYSYEKKVYLVSPTTLMAYLSAIKSFYLQSERSLKVVEIQQEYAKLSKEFERFVLRWQTISKDFEKMNTDVRNMDITCDKIMRRFEQIEACDLQSNQNLSYSDENHL